MRIRFLLTAALASLSSMASSVQAEIKLPNIFSDHMVLQQGQENKIWGKGEPGETVTITLGDKKVTCKADSKGDWSAMLPAMGLGEPLVLKVAGSSTIEAKDVLIGEVWICSGQSNMQWSVNASNDPDLEKLSAKYPKIRMINFPQKGTQEAIWSHDDRKWMVTTPESVGSFSAVGYFFARQLHQTTDVPIGMINNAWGGSACEAWVNRSVLSAEFPKLVDRWKGMEDEFAKLNSKADRNDQENKRLGDLGRQMSGNARPGNIYNGVLKSHLGYGIKGAIWYQGESNAGRAYQYRELFPRMIKNWRDEWGQGDFPFYWVQLADFQAEAKEPGDSDWAELREAQTMAMDKVPNSGQAVIIDIGEGKDIHPTNKEDVGKRLARWALAKQYGIQIDYQSPRYDSMAVEGDKAIVSFKHVGSGWRPFDVNEVIGFTVAGEDKKFYNATAKILKDGRIEVSAPEVKTPVSVRYAWATNPVCNLFSKNGLPVTPFRTDDWPGVTMGRD
ncbi:sialate O-acetylesterase [Pirellulaceae bacterium SH467]